MCLRSFAAYKADYFLYMAINMVFFYISIALWLTVYKSGNISDINSYTISNTITYYLLTSLIFRIDLSNAIYLGEEIWSGQFTNDLVKPWRVISVHLMATLGEVIINLISFIPFLLFMMLTSARYISVPSLLNFSAFIVTLVLAFAMNYFFNLIFHSLTFRYGDRSTMISLVNFVSSFLAGAVFPLAFLSGVYFKFITLLPFKYLFHTPIEIFLGKMSFNQILSSWAHILVWTILFYIIFKIVYTTGLKRYDGVGR